MDSIRKVYQYAEPNLTLVGWMGLIGFPTYYAIWGYMFPQTYESLPARMLCSLLFLGLITRNKLSAKWRSYMPWFYQVVTTLCLPAFFFYMLLMNDWSHVWVMSFMAAIFLHILLVHITWVMFVQTFVGVGLAILSAYISKGYELSINVEWAHLPIFLFVYLFGNMFYFRNQVGHESKVSIAKSFGAGIAHEMRNPLSSLLSSIEVIQSILPSDKSSKADHYTLSGEQIALLREVSSDALKVIHAGNETIDLLLTSIDENRVSRRTFKRFYAQQVIDNAVSSFAYPSGIDMSCVSVQKDADFAFLGSDTLFKYVIYNLIKNAFHYRSDNDFTVNIRLFTNKQWNCVEVKDAGVGIAPDALQDIFKDFYTTGSKGNHGLGLPFCKKVMASFGGRIECKSVVGEWTKFTLFFPKWESKKVAEIKYELMKLKSVLFISGQPLLLRKATRLAHSEHFNISFLDVNQLDDLQECESEHDIIIIDIESLWHEHTRLLKLESKLHFTQGKIVYLYKDKPFSRANANTLPVLWVETQFWLLNAKSLIERLMFEDIELSSRPQPGQAYPQRERNILVVDDNESLRKFTSLLLEQQGFTVVQCGDGHQALSELEQKRFDLVLMDIEMPNLDGLETTRQIRQSESDYAQIPIIAHTGDSSKVAIDRISSSGMSDYLVKPADKEQLYAKVSNWV